MLPTKSPNNNPSFQWCLSQIIQGCAAQTSRSKYLEKSGQFPTLVFWGEILDKQQPWDIGVMSASLKVEHKKTPRQRISFDQKKKLHAMETFSILAPFENLRMTYAPYNRRIYRIRIRRYPRMTLASYNGKIYPLRIRRYPRMTLVSYNGKFLR